MIKFFRKIRLSLLTNNLPVGGTGKFRKYLLYAVGEIFLVVIGILIALWINNWNQDRIKQLKIESILVKIQNDLLLDIDQGENLIANYIRKDSIGDRLIGENLNYEDVKAIPKYGRFGIEYVTTWWTDYQLHSNGYDQLMSILDDLPDDYDEVLKMLDANYRKRQELFESMSKHTQDIVMQYRYYLAANYSWPALDNYNAEMSDEQIEYIINNPRFKNQISLLVNSFSTLAWQSMKNRKELIELYMMINELLGEKARTIPNVIKTTSLADETDAVRLIGTYLKTSGPDNTEPEEKIEISNVGKNLYIRINRGRAQGPLLNVVNGKPWFSIIDQTRIFQFDRNGENTIRVINPNTQQTHWLKTK